MKRIFIAVKVDPDGMFLELISKLKSLLAAEKIKWVDPINIHITLAFLGDTEENKIKTIDRMLKEISTGFPKFDFMLEGTGIFKNYWDPRVIWVGIKSPEKLYALENKITEGLKSTGFIIEERKFKPHLTLGRVKSVVDTENLKNVLERYGDIQIQIVHVSEVILYESILMQTGPLYKPLGKFSLP
jgi:RNA 2',3'-cyclic 3'-phosphodiesterase